MSGPNSNVARQALRNLEWLVVSELTRLECRIVPIRRGDSALLEDFDEFFTDYIDEVVALTREVIDKATEFRAQYGYKTLDSIHLSAVLVAGCDVFLTNDLRLKGFADVQVITL